MVSAFGSTDVPTSSGYDPVSILSPELPGPLTDLLYRSPLRTRWGSGFSTTDLTASTSTTRCGPSSGVAASLLIRIVQDFAAINKQDGSAEAWLESFTKQLRVKLPQGQYLLTHARAPLFPPSLLVKSRCSRSDDTAVAPWFSASQYKSGAYHAVNAAVGSLIDWVCFMLTIQWGALF